MKSLDWQTQKVHGRDEVLLDIEKRAIEYGNTVVQDIRTVMHDYEVDMYRLVLGIGKHFGMDRAYEIMSDTVAEKRLKWLDQVISELEFNGTEVENGLCLYLKYFRPKEDDFRIIEQTEDSVVVKRKDFINAIANACDVLGLDVIEVNNKVYARAMNFMYKRINLPLMHIFLNYQDGWYDEMIKKAH
jgi:hypothetical protein